MGAGLVEDGAGGALFGGHAVAGPAVRKMGVGMLVEEEGLGG